MLKKFIPALIIQLVISSLIIVTPGIERRTAEKNKEEYEFAVNAIMFSEESGYEYDPETNVENEIKYCTLYFEFEPEIKTNNSKFIDGFGEKEKQTWSINIVVDKKTKGYGWIRLDYSENEKLSKLFSGNDYIHPDKDGKFTFSDCLREKVTLKCSIYKDKAYFEGLCIGNIEY